MLGLVVNGRGEPMEMTRDAGGWRVRFEFGRTSSGEFGIARIEIAPGRPDGVIPDEEGITTEVMKHVHLGTARRYLWTRNREVAALAKGKRRTPTDKGSQRYLKLLARESELVQAGDPHPAKTIAKELGMMKRRVTVRVWLTRARELRDAGRLPAVLPAISGRRRP